MSDHKELPLAQVVLDWERKMASAQAQCNMTTSERMQQALQQRGITIDPDAAPDYTEDGLITIEGDK